MADENTPSQSLLRNLDADTSITDDNPDNQVQLSEASLRDNTPTNTKRKGSPLYKTSVKRLTPSRTTRKSGQSSKQQPNINFADMLLVTFKEPTFVEGIAPIFVTMLTPLIKHSIEQTAKSTLEQMTNCIMETADKANSKLLETISHQADVINQLQEENRNQKQQIRELSDNFKSIKAETQLLRSEINTIKKSSNDTEQYSRRNSLRINNLKFNSNTDESNLTKQVVGFINSKMLQSSSAISVADVERCHPVGKPNEDGGKQVLIKFKSYASKHLVYGAKSKLKNNPDHVFITEDLTRANYLLIKSLLTLKKSKKISSFWTTNGRIMVKVNETSSPIRVTSKEDINNFV